MRFRESVRALICDPSGHVLLVRFDWVGLDVKGGIWATPGGGVERGETTLAALQRELGEEVGLVVDHLGPEIWTRTAPWPLPPWDGQVDHVHLHRTERFVPAPGFTAEQLAAENVRELRWWSPEEIARRTASFAPRCLPELMDRLRREGVPDQPVQVHGL